MSEVSCGKDFVSVLAEELRLLDPAFFKMIETRIQQGMRHEDIEMNLAEVCRHVLAGVHSSETYAVRTRGNEWLAALLLLGDALQKQEQALTNEKS